MIKDNQLTLIKKLLIFSIIIFLALFTQAKTPKKATQAVKPPPVVLEIVEQTVPIDGKPTKIFNIEQPNGVFGYVGQKGQMFDVIVKNKTSEWTLLHWQGLIMPNSQDGAPFVTQQPIAPGAEFHYQFPLIQSGTFWMNSHYPSQLQKLMAAPLIIKDPKENQDAQDVVMFLQDYEFGDTRERYAQLRQQLLEKTANIQVASQQQTETPPKELAMDAYLTNHRTLEDPDVVHVTPGSLVKLRIINASTNTNFFVNLGQLQGRIVATDSEPTAPLDGFKFQLGQGQRLDIEVLIPEGDNAYPILAQAAGTTQQTGLILATPNAVVPKVSSIASGPTENLDYSQEFNLRATYPLLPHSVNRSYVININGNLLSYIWTMNREVWPNVKPLQTQLDDRVELVLNNKSGLPIPLHLHGHVFQITEIDGKKLRGSIRDTLLLLPNSTVKVQFDADNPGAWLLRGLVPFQAYGGLGTLINYEGTTVPIFKQKDTGIPPLSLR